MSKLPIVDAKEFERLLLKLGFEIQRQKGSHKLYKHPDGRYTTIAHHPGETISRPLIRTNSQSNRFINRRIYKVAE